ncbi:MAG: Uma2 family endonuclease [Salinivirgaceae bacterium]|nr:Uma2 family endonuclease [Salinivirgaceae bacterium]
METNISSLDINKTYNYAQYLTWRFQERIEIIKGRLFKMSPAPARKHQEASGDLFRQISSFLYKKPCSVFSAPFDVRFPKGNSDEETYTVVQPDICIICDKSKLDDRGCIGAPDFIIEILSPSTAEKDTKDKFQLYQEQGVKEYWMVYPGEHMVDVFKLDKRGKYQFDAKYVKSDKVRVGILPELEIILDDVFRDD